MAHAGPILDFCKIILIAVQHISTHMALARCVGLWLTGVLSAADFVRFFPAETCGAIVGVLLVFYLNCLS